MKAILISDHAKWCALMMNGLKNIEVRKGTALYKATQKLIDEYGYAEIYVCCTKGNEDIVRVSSPYSSVPDYDCVKIDKKLSKDLPEYKYSSSGKVIFKFRCYNVEEILIKSNGNYYTNTLSNNKLLTQSCLSQKEILEYAGSHISKISGCWFVGYAIHISDLEIFDEPKEIIDYSHWVSYKNCMKCPFEKYHGRNPCLEIEALAKAPQNYCYVEVE